MFAGEVFGGASRSKGHAVVVPPLPPNINRPEWRDLLSAVAIVWYLFILIMVGFIVIWQVYFHGDEAFMEGPEAIMIDASIGVIAVVAAWVFTCGRYGRSITDGFYLRPINASAFALSLLAGLVCAIIAILVTSRLADGVSDLEGFLIQPAVDETSKAVVHYAVILVILPKCLCSEIFYRGFAFPILRKTAGPVRGAALTVGLAMLPWFLILGLERQFFDLIYLAIIGVVLTWMRHRYESLLPCLVARGAAEVTCIVWLIASVRYGNG